MTDVTHARATQQPPASPETQIIVENVRKTFAVAVRRPGIGGAIAGLLRRQQRTVTALNKISFTSQAGELIGLVGPNGAGKSTTVKILAGILVPDAGRCQVNGRVPWQQRIEHVRRIGVMFGHRTQLWWDLPVIESFDLLGAMYRIPAPEQHRNRDALIAALDLHSLLDVPVRQLSLGQRMRCDLAATMLHDPDILILDEPTIGLDAVSKLAVRDFIKQLNRQRGVTVILTTNDMTDIEALCERVIVLANGAILCDGTLDDLRARVPQQRRLIVDLETSGAVIDDPDAIVTAREGHRVHLAFDPQRVATAALIARITAQHPVRDLFVETPPIEQIIARLYAEIN